MKLKVAPTVDPADRPAWLEWRRGGIGASEMPAILGVSPYKTALDVYLEKIGRGRPSDSTEQQRIGLACEPAIARLYQEETGRTIANQQLPAVCEGAEYLRATLDAVTACGRLVEFKTCGSMTGRDLGEVGTDELPHAWLVQAHHQMLVADAPCVDFAVLCGGYALQFKTFTVERSAEWDGVVRERGGEFWDRVLMHNPPSPVLPADVRNLSRLFPVDGFSVHAERDLADAIARWEAFGQEMRRIDSERETLEGFIRQAMKGAGSVALEDGRTLKRYVREVAGRVQTIKPHTVDYLRIVKGAKS